MSTASHLDRLCGGFRPGSEIGSWIDRGGLEGRDVRLFDGIEEQVDFSFDFVGVGTKAVCSLDSFSNSPCWKR